MDAAIDQSCSVLSCAVSLFVSVGQCIVELPNALDLSTPNATVNCVVGVIDVPGVSDTLLYAPTSLAIHANCTTLYALHNGGTRVAVISLANSSIRFHVDLTALGLPPMIGLLTDRSANVTQAVSHILYLWYSSFIVEMDIVSGFVYRRIGSGFRGCPRLSPLLALEAEFPGIASVQIIDHEVIVMDTLGTVYVVDSTGYPHLIASSTGQKLSLIPPTTIVAISTTVEMVGCGVQFCIGISLDTMYFYDTSSFVMLMVTPLDTPLLLYPVSSTVIDGGANILFFAFGNVSFPCVLGVSILTGRAVTKIGDCLALTTTPNTTVPSFPTTISGPVVAEVFGLAVMGSTLLLIADRSYNLLLLVNLTSSTIDIFAGSPSCQQGFADGPRLSGACFGGALLSVFLVGSTFSADPDLARLIVLEADTFVLRRIFSGYVSTILLPRDASIIQPSLFASAPFVALDPNSNSSVFVLFDLHLPPAGSGNTIRRVGRLGLDSGVLLPSELDDSTIAGGGALYSVPSSIQGGPAKLIAVSPNTVSIYTLPPGQSTGSLAATLAPLVDLSERLRSVIACPVGLNGIPVSVMAATTVPVYRYEQVLDGGFCSSWNISSVFGAKVNCSSTLPPYFYSASSNAIAASILPATSSLVVVNFSSPSLTTVNIFGLSYLCARLPLDQQCIRDTCTSGLLDLGPRGVDIPLPAPPIAPPTGDGGAFSFDLVQSNRGAFAETLVLSNGACLYELILELGDIFPLAGTHCDALTRNSQRRVADGDAQRTAVFYNIIAVSVLVVDPLAVGIDDDEAIIIYVAEQLGGEAFFIRRISSGFVTSVNLETAVAQRVAYQQQHRLVFAAWSATSVVLLDTSTVRLIVVNAISGSSEGTLLENYLSDTSAVSSVAWSSLLSSLFVARTSVPGGSAAVLTVTLLSLGASYKRLPPVPNPLLTRSANATRIVPVPEVRVRGMCTLMTNDTFYVVTIGRVVTSGYIIPLPLVVDAEDIENIIAGILNSNAQHPRTWFMGPTHFAACAIFSNDRTESPLVAFVGGAANTVDIVTANNFTSVLHCERSIARKCSGALFTNPQGLAAASAIPADASRLLAAAARTPLLARPPSPDNIVLIADTGNHCIRILSSHANWATFTLVGTCGKRGVVGGGQLASNSSTVLLSFPYDVELAVLRDSSSSAVDVLIFIIEPLPISSIRLVSLRHQTARLLTSFQTFDLSLSPLSSFVFRSAFYMMQQPAVGALVIFDKKQALLVAFQIPVSSVLATTSADDLGSVFDAVMASGSVADLSADGWGINASTGSWIALMALGASSSSARCSVLECIDPFSKCVGASEPLDDADGVQQVAFRHYRLLLSHAICLKHASGEW